MIALSSVDLPAPLGPMTATTSPGAAVIAASSRKRVPLDDDAGVECRAGHRGVSGRQARTSSSTAIAVTSSSSDRATAVPCDDARPVEGGVDGERHRLRHPRGVAGEQRGRPELADRAGEAQDDARGESRRGERQRHAAQDRPPARTESGRGLLVADPGGAQRPLDGEHEERQRDERLREDDRARRERDADPPLAQHAAEPARPAEQVEQGDAADHRRQHERHGDERPQHAGQPRASCARSRARAARPARRRRGSWRGPFRARAAAPRPPRAT